MPITAAQLIAKVGAEGVDKTKADLQSVGSSANMTGGIFKSALGGPLSLVAGIAGKAFSFLKDQTTDAIKIAMEHQSVMAQTAQAIKSTGDASGLSAGQIGDMATSLSKVTPFSEDAIQSGQNLLLTFTGIGKQAFPLATKAMVDLSQAMGQDMKSSAIQLGKALNDPLTGMSALQRVGVTFSDTEKQQIKTAMAHNDVLGAQKVMLRELNTEFGGSAQAAGHTLAGALAILKNNFDDLKEKVGGAVIPIFSNLIQMINTTILPAIEHFFGALSKNAMVKSALKDIGDVLFQVGEVLKPLGGLADIFTGKIKDVTGKASPLLAGLSKDFHGMIIDIQKTLSTINLRPFVQAVQDLVSHIDFKQIASGFGQVFQIIQNASPSVNLIKDLASHAQELGKWFQTSVVPALNNAQPGFNSLKQALAGLLPAFQTISGVIRDVFTKAFNALLPIFEKAVPLIIQIAGYIADGLGKAIKFITPYFIQATTEIGKFAGEIIDRVAPIISKFFDNVKIGLDFFKAHWSQIWGYVGPLLQGVWDTIVGIVKVAWSVVSGVIKIGLDVMSGNWKGAWNDLKSMLSGIWDGIRGIISGGLETINALFGGMPGKLLQWGEDMIQGLINGIMNMIGGIGNAVAQVAGVISSHLHFSKPEIGPLTDVESWMPDFTDLLSKGLLAGIPKLKSAMTLLAVPISASMNPAQSSFAGGSSGYQFPSVANSAPTIIINVPPGNTYLDGRLLTNGLMPYIADAIRYNTGSHL